jgi:inner membrane protein
MDNLAHTLAGAALAEAGLKRKTALATPTLMIAANLPDIDALVSFAGSDAALYFRRGITHGVLAWLVLPAALAGVMIAWDRYVRRRRRPDAEPVKIGALFALSYLGLLTHPFLDWLNTYGVRLLMPFDGRWFYGDTLFIVDPWLWLLLGSSVVLASSRSKFGVAGWAVLATGTTALVLGVAPVHVAIKIVWLVSVGAIALLRVTGWMRGRSSRVALVTVGVAALYIGAMLAASAHTATLARAEFEGRGVEVERAFANPSPGNPFRRDGIVVGADAYYFYEGHLLADPPLVESRPPLPIEPPDEIVEAALASPAVRGFRNWMRFPSWEVRRRGDGWLVIVRDLRFASADDEQGFGVVRIALDENLDPR